MPPDLDVLSVSSAALSSVLSLPPGPMTTALGLMSGTSLDGIDLALMTTDGGLSLRPGPAMMIPYEGSTRTLLREALEAAVNWSETASMPAVMVEAERVLTCAHERAVDEFRTLHGLWSEDIDLIGFHGQTVLHQPDKGRTVQLGRGDWLARGTGIDVISDFRSADVEAGGHGAPLAPLYHTALTALSALETPLAVVNIGGIANLSFIDLRSATRPLLLAFDTGPGNGLLDDWISHHLDQPLDAGGRLALAGQVDETALARLMAPDFFAQPPPKSLDRLHFDLTGLDHLTVADGAATLTAFTATTLARALDHLPAAPLRWIICGGGRRNPALMAALASYLPGSVEPAESVGWRGDDLEAEAFAWLAVRSVRNLPFSLPCTTGVPRPVSGGRRHFARRR